MTGFVVQGHIFYNEMYSCNSKDEFTEYADLVLSYFKVLLVTFNCILQCLYININIIKWKLLY